MPLSPKELLEHLTRLKKYVLRCRLNSAGPIRSVSDGSAVTQSVRVVTTSDEMNNKSSSELICGRCRTDMMRLSVCRM